MEWHAATWDATIETNPVLVKQKKVQKNAFLVYKSKIETTCLLTIIS